MTAGAGTVGFSKSGDWGGIGLHFVLCSDEMISEPILASKMKKSDMSAHMSWPWQATIGAGIMRLFYQAHCSEGHTYIYIRNNLCSGCHYSTVRLQGMVKNGRPVAVSLYMSLPTVITCFAALVPSFRQMTQKYTKYEQPTQAPRKKQNIDCRIFCARTPRERLDQASLSGPEDL